MAESISGDLAPFDLTTELAKMPAAAQKLSLICGENAEPDSIKMRDGLVLNHA